MAPATPHQPVRADGIDARQRLLAAGIRLFAEHGFEKTSVRALAQAAGVNLGAISYYFGDKEGLYRALFVEPPVGCAPEDLTAFADPGRPLAEAMRLFFVDFLEPLKMGEEFRMVMKLHFREMAEPTGAWTHAVDAQIRPQFEALLRLLVRELGLRRADLDLHRLALSIAGLGVHFFAFHDGVTTLSPTVLSTPRAVDTLAERLAGYAVSMVEGERARATGAGVLRPSEFEQRGAAIDVADRVVRRQLQTEIVGLERLGESSQPEQHVCGLEMRFGEPGRDRRRRSISLERGAVPAERHEGVGTVEMRG